MFYNAFPDDLKNELNHVHKILPVKTFNDISETVTDKFISYVLDNCNVEIPYRMYLIDIDDSEYNSLNQTQKQILCCIYTRSCDGYIREKYLRKLLDMPFEQWAIPFIVKLCDEYVIEILEVIYDKLRERDNADIKDFCLKNKDSIRKSYSRMVSYWYVYYRKHEFDFKKYVGKSLFKEYLGCNKGFGKAPPRA